MVVLPGGEFLEPGRDVRHGFEAIESVGEHLRASRGQYRVGEPEELVDHLGVAESAS